MCHVVFGHKKAAWTFCKISSFLFLGNKQTCYNKLSSFSYVAFENRILLYIDLACSDSYVNKVFFNHCWTWSLPSCTFWMNPFEIPFETALCKWVLFIGNIYLNALLHIWLYSICSILMLPLLLRLFLC